MTVRITGGCLRGRSVASPVAGVRPTASRMREALFSIWGDRVSGCRFLDLFAGSGIMGIEAISRGAAEAWFIEGAPRVVTRLAQTVTSIVGDHGAVLRGRLPEVLAKPPPVVFDVAFADPPYTFDAYETLLERSAPWLAPEGEIAIEHSTRRTLVADVSSLQRFEQRAWGESAVSRYRLKAAVIR